jgi:NAD(P)-dependent dehydrogenase (short-subunit alcohol dehydrogenase family)
VAGDFSGAEEQTAALYGDEVVAHHCDVTQEVDVEALVAKAVSTFGRLDVMLNVAGIADGCMVADITDEMYDRIVNVDLRGVMWGMKYAIRAMRDNGSGSIVNWSSVGGLNGAPGTAIYSAAKAGVLAATRSAAIECGPMGIRVNAICPGFILTEIMGAMGADIPGIAEKAALNRVGQSIEVAEVGAFLASDLASFVTGAVIPVDGGWSARLA